MCRVRITLIIVGLLVCLTTKAAERVCGLDINNNGSLAEQGETATCQAATSGEYSCPIRRIDCTEHTVQSETTRTEQQTGTCEHTNTRRGSGFFSFLTFYEHTCSVTGATYENMDFYASQNQCVLNCTNIPVEVTEQTTESSWINPITNEQCDENIGTVAAPNFVDSTINCVEHIPQSIEIEETAGFDETGVMSDDGECSGEFQIFRGSVSRCRKNGYQTRWDNCCNNPPKIVSDSFSEASTRETAEATNQMVIDMFSGFFGEDATNAMTKLNKTVSDGFSYVFPDELDPMTLHGIAMNWLMTPCADDSEDLIFIGSGMCHLLGEKCIEQWDLIGCVQHAQIHCCFKTMLSRIFQEQAREQLGMSWGTPEEPNCEGFTPEQFQAIDFSRMDLTEYLDEVRHKASGELQNDLQDKFSEQDFNQGGS